MKKLMFAAAVGAALMWFYDPTSGAQRRDSLQRRLNRGNPGAATEPSAHVPDTNLARPDSAIYAAR